MIRIESADLLRVAAFASDSRPAQRINRQLWNSIGRAAEKVRDEMRAEVQRPGGTRSANPRSTGLRAGIAAGLKVRTIRTSREAGAAVEQTGTGLSGDRRSLAMAWDKPGGWSHPVFAQANRSAPVVRQIGRPYFGSVARKAERRVAADVERAWLEAAEQVADLMNG